MLNVTYQKHRLQYWGELVHDRLTPPRRRDPAGWHPPANVFFVTGHGRSGTQFLAHLFDGARNAVVGHEPVKADIFAVQRARLEPDFGTRYVETYRRWKIADAAAHAAPGRYGEVNSRLRSVLPALRASFPDAPMVRIMRDGRDVVRSMLARDRWMIDVLVRRAPRLVPADPFIDELARMTPFEQACWYWRFDMTQLARTLPDHVRFEDIMADPACLYEQLVEPLGLDLDAAQIETVLRKPRNETREHAIAGWREWSPAETASFWRICGDVMEAHGYER